MVIVFANQKGGAGKSTLAVAFANCLTLIKKRKLIVLDMDYQRSIYQRYEEAKQLENPELYEVLEVDLETFPSIYNILKEEKEQVIVIDLPGKIDDENLIPVLQAADIFIIPFAYDKSTYLSTQFFTLVAQELNPQSRKYFIPNRQKAGVKFDTAEIDKDFERYGKVTPSVPDRVAFQRLTTKDIPVELVPIVENVFEDIFKEINT